VEVEVLGVLEVDRRDAAVAERNEPVGDAGDGVLVEVEGEMRDAAGVPNKKAVDSNRRCAALVDEGEGDAGEGLPPAAPGASEDGGADGVPELEAGEDGVEQGRREGAQQIRRRLARPRAVARWLHSVTLARVTVSLQ
jgi:hypothetical protein